MSSFYEELLAEARAHLADGARPGTTLLDVGCGSGGADREFTTAGFRVTGLDRDRFALVRARTSGSEMATVLADAGHMPLRSGSIDAILSVSVMQYVPWRSVVLECHRVLKPGGRAVFIENLRSNPFVRSYRFIRRIAWAFPVGETLTRMAADATPLAHLDWRERYEFAAPFPSADFRGHHVLTPLALVWAFVAPARFANRQALGATAFRVLASVDTRLIHRLPGIQSLAWIMVVKVRKEPTTTPADGDTSGRGCVATSSKV